MAKKKARRKSQTTPGEDPNLRRRERLEARRRQKAEEAARQRRAQQRERVVRWILIGGFLAGAVWFFFLRGQIPDEIAGYTVESHSRAGANDHVSQTGIQYETTPPVSGQHAPTPIPCGIYGEPVPNERFVHTLEHGAVAVVYQPTLPVEDIARIEEIVGSYDDHTLSAPSPDIDSPIVVAAWAHLMKLETVDEPAIREFIDVFRAGGVAPEAENDCTNSAQDPFDLEPSPLPSGVPTPAPSPDGTTDGRDQGEGGKKGKRG